ncbi:hypothetical protein FF1_024551 [Malus domestica]
MTPSTTASWGEHLGLRGLLLGDTTASAIGRLWLTRLGYRLYRSSTRREMNRPPEFPSTWRASGRRSCGPRRPPACTTAGPRGCRAGLSQGNFRPVETDSTEEVMPGGNRGGRRVKHRRVPHGNFEDGGVGLVGGLADEGEGLVPLEALGFSGGFGRDIVVGSGDFNDRTAAGGNEACLHHSDEEVVHLLHQIKRRPIHRHAFCWLQLRRIVHYWWHWHWLWAIDSVEFDIWN